MAATLDTPAAGTAVPILAGNDARLAGLAEARRGGLRDLPVALHLHLATGVGGVLLSGGLPLTGAHGAAGEFGHMPLTGGTESCRCGSVGCWELDVGSHGLLRRAGRTEEGDRIDLALDVISDAATDPAAPARWPGWPRRWAGGSAPWSTRTIRPASACPAWAVTSSRPRRRRCEPGTKPR